MERRTFCKILGLGAASQVLPAVAEAAGKPRPPRYAMFIDLRRCVGCQACTVSCAVENRVPLGDFRTVVSDYAVDVAPGPRQALLPRLCNHCEQPACVPVCPVKATTVRLDGIVVIDANRCLGCGFCVQACPYGARFLNFETNTADKCTFCLHRIAAGLLPACVETCVGGARLFGDVNDPQSLIARQLAKHRGQLRVLLPEKNTRPAVYYLAMNPALTDPARTKAQILEQPGGRHV
jgi:tetrathionate reductase subunit B